MKSLSIKGILCSFLVVLTFIFSASLHVKAEEVTTPESSIPTLTNTDEYSITVNSTGGSTRTYHIYAQGASYQNPKGYIAAHGCAACSLTTILSAYSPTYMNYTPHQTSQILEKKFLGTKTWNSNYKQKSSQKRPVSLYGITKILNKCGIKATYVRSFSNASAVRTIENNLKQGKPVIIEVTNHRQNNGKFSSRYDKKWATTKHTMALIGMTDTGKVIVADSAQRTWSGTMQRVKLTNMSDLVHYMIPCTKSGRNCYFKSQDNSGGFVLIK